VLGDRPPSPPCDASAACGPHPLVCSKPDYPSCSDDDFVAAEPLRAEQKWHVLFSWDSPPTSPSTSVALDLVRKECRRALGHPAQTMQRKSLTQSRNPKTNLLAVAEAQSVHVKERMLLMAVCLCDHRRSSCSSPGATGSMASQWGKVPEAREPRGRGRGKAPSSRRQQPASRESPSTCPAARWVPSQRQT